MADKTDTVTDHRCKPRRVSHANEYAICGVCGREWIGRQDPERRDQMFRSNFGRYWEPRGHRARYEEKDPPA